MESLWTNQHWIQGFLYPCCLFGRCRRHFRYLFPMAQIRDRKWPVAFDSKSVGFDAEKRRYFSVPWCWMEIDIPQHVLFNEESKVAWSYQKGKYYQQVDSPSTYTQDPSVICTQKGLKIWYRPERKHQIRSRCSPVPKLHICEATHPIRERPSKDPTTKQPSTKFWIWGKNPKELEDLSFAHLWPFPPPSGHLRHILVVLSWQW